LSPVGAVVELQIIMDLMVEVVLVPAVFFLHLPLLAQILEMGHLQSLLGKVALALQEDQALVAMQYQVR
jgi:hypothetical protein